jgi:hypothetical protein
MTSSSPVSPESRTLELKSAITDPDDFYEALLDAHAGLSPSESADLNARLILVMANQIAHNDILKQCIQAAKSAE